jgi:hypothetical protein
LLSGYTGAGAGLLGDIGQGLSGLGGGAPSSMPKRGTIRTACRGSIDGAAGSTHFGGVIPFRPTFIRAASKVPSGNFFAAVTLIAAPGLISLLFPTCRFVLAHGPSRQLLAQTQTAGVELEPRQFVCDRSECLLEWVQDKQIESKVYTPTT